MEEFIGRPTGKSRFVVERGHVWKFAQAVKDPNEVYRDPAKAEAAGFAAPTVPPTYGFVMDNSAAYPDMQPDDATSGNDTMMTVMMELRKRNDNKGLILHGEQEFIYHRPICAGDVLVREGRIKDIYERESKGRKMTFVVTEDTYSDDKTGEVVLTTRFNVLHRA